MGSLESENREKRELDDGEDVNDDAPPAKRLAQSPPEERQCVYLLDLSDDVLLLILKHCTPIELKAVGFTCERLAYLIQDHTLWHNVDARDVPYGRKRFHWLLNVALSDSTKVLKLAGFAREPTGKTVLDRTVYDEEENYNPDEVNTSKSTQTSDNDFESFPNKPLTRLKSVTKNISSPGSSEEQAGSSSANSKSEDEKKEQRPIFTFTPEMLNQLSAQCKNLTTLYLEYCNINNEHTDLGCFPRTLKELSLKGTRIYNVPFEKSFLYKAVDYLDSLEYLDVSECNWMEGHVLLSISKMSKLKTLIMRNCLRMYEFVAYASLAGRYGFKQLQVLDVRGSPFCDSELTAFGWLPVLREMYLAPRAPRSAAYAHADTPDHFPWEAEEPECFQFNYYKFAKKLQEDEDKKGQASNGQDGSSAKDKAKSNKGVDTKEEYNKTVTYFWQLMCNSMERSDHQRELFHQEMLRAGVISDRIREMRRVAALQAGRRPDGAQDGRPEDRRSVAGQQDVRSAEDQQDGRPKYGLQDGRPIDGAQDGRPADGLQDGKRVAGQQDVRPAEDQKDGRPAEGQQDGKRVAGLQDGKPAEDQKDGRPAEGQQDGKRVAGLQDGKPAEDQKDGRPAEGQQDGRRVAVQQDGRPVEDKKDGTPANRPQDDRQDGRSAEGQQDGRPAEGPQDGRPVEDQKDGRPTDDAQDSTRADVSQVDDQEENKHVIVTQECRQQNGAQSDSRQHGEPVDRGSNVIVVDCKRIGNECEVSSELNDRRDSKQSDLPKPGPSQSKDPNEPGPSNKRKIDNEPKEVKFKRQCPLYLESPPQQQNGQGNLVHIIQAEIAVENNANVGHQNLGLGQNVPRNLPRNRVLYVNFGRQIPSLVYRMAIEGGVPNCTLSNDCPRLRTNRLNGTLLVTDATVFRFGRSDHEIMNMYPLGHRPANPRQLDQQETGGRPNRSSLRVLSVTGYRNITDRSLHHLASSAPNLRTLDLSETNVTDMGVEAFKVMQPDCEVKYSKFKSEQ